MTVVKGLSHKNSKEPSLINNDLLKFSSIRPPNTKARIRGGIGKLLRLLMILFTVPLILRLINKKRASYSK